MKPIKLNQIQQMNLIWIAYSFALLYLSYIKLVTVQISILLIFILFIYMLHKGTKVKTKDFDKWMLDTGDEVQGQWKDRR